MGNVTFIVTRASCCVEFVDLSLESYNKNKDEDDNIPITERDTMGFNFSELPESYRSDIVRAVEILKAEGCTEIYLFGSLADGTFTEKSDIDIAVTGCKPDMFFAIFGELMLSLKNRVDLVNLDRNDKFSMFLKREGNLVNVA